MEHFYFCCKYFLVNTKGAAKLTPKITSKIRYKNTRCGCNLPFTANFNIGLSLANPHKYGVPGTVDLDRFPLSCIRETAEMARKTTTPRVTVDSQTSTSVLFMALSELVCFIQVGETYNANKEALLCHKPPSGLFGFMRNNEICQLVKRS